MIEIDPVPEVPPQLFKYRSISSVEAMQRTLDVIRECRLYWPSPLQFNDPFDCAPAQIYEGSKQEHARNAQRSAVRLGRGRPRHERRQMKRQALARSPKQIVDVMREANSQMLKNVGVCSMSAINDHILMWSHYADAHAGICLGFSPSLEAIDFACAFPVVYQKKRPVINLIQRSKGEYLLQKVLLTKADFWAYEQEWRLIDQNSGPTLRRFPAPSLTALILGARILPEDREVVLDAVRQIHANPRLFQANNDPNEFRLRIEPLEN